MEHNARVVSACFVTSVIVALLAVLAYNLAFVAPHMRRLERQVAALSETANQHAVLLNMHSRLIERLADESAQNAQDNARPAAGADRLAGKVNHNTNAANENATLRSRY